ncbi:MAG: UDP-N-acetylglucosamine 2-epimerase (hydrolyzing) [Rheinheimera sp.]|uniref:UDP-N-acetylglucosamine 2-epimerase n=1 Tax=Arsukibacterium sp. UBA3155 TaxID=1946058 RepID=UPI000C973DFD|nr:UDP-N-acetylglucosamine 2-epimerase [Arsukibacterium sp. UBA3155]MAD74951.1 UDP-N-acetylglucosamine 2-epimerase (hydrolyzing) [Rheinheimera sp.]|tara:strand:+ start:192861 stop:194015 length:1155 start_codon:yes stop_codon:yes gene_type:complete
MQKKVAVFTGTRAEYGLLYWLLHDINADSELQLQLLVTGSHLSPEFGNTYQQIIADGFDIADKIEILLSSDSSVGTVKSMGLALIGLADSLSRLQPDVLILLGDRFEALAAAQAAMLMKIPVLHLHGGEITEGATDDAIRHAITKLSYWHATSTEVYRQRVIQLGESPERVKNVGAIGLDHLKRTRLLSRDQLADALDFKLNQPYFVVTYHPVTLAEEPPLASFNALLNALDQFKQYQIILTYPNADEGGRQIIERLLSYAAEQPDRVLAVTSLGQLRYLSAVKHAAAIIGNSSSGIIEVPAFNVPTVNIGARQQGRLAAPSVQHCRIDTSDIAASIKRVLSNAIPVGDNPYGQGNVSANVIQMIKQLHFNPVKKFYDLPGAKL